jgi:hypothetical protein
VDRDGFNCLKNPRPSIKKSKFYMYFSAGCICINLHLSGVISELKESDVFVNTDVRCRGRTRLKTVFVSVCGNLQHI